MNTYTFLKKKGKTRLTLCSIKLTWILFVFYLAWNRSAAKKFWPGLQFLLSQTFSCNTCKCPVISRGRWLTVEILLTIITPCSVGTAKIKVPGFSTKFYIGRLRPGVQPLTILYTIFDRKGTSSIGNYTPFTCLVWNFASLLTAVNTLSLKYDKVTKADRLTAV